MCLGKTEKRSLNILLHLKALLYVCSAFFLDIKNYDDAHHNLEKIRNRNHNRFNDKYIGNGVALQFEGEYETKKEN